MDLLAYLAQRCRQVMFDDRVAVFIIRCDGYLSGFVRCGQGIQGGLDLVLFVGRQQADLLDGPGMGAGTFDIVWQEQGVPQVILADGKSDHPIFSGGVLLPEFHDAK